MSRRYRHARRRERTEFRGNSRCHPGHHPAEDLGAMVDNIGIPVSGINMSYNNTGIDRPAGRRYPDRAESRPSPDTGICQPFARRAAARFPGATFSFLPADIVEPDSELRRADADRSADQGPKLEPNFDYARKLLRKIPLVPGVADARIQQSRRESGLQSRVDRSRAQYVGVTERDVTDELGNQPFRHEPSLADLLAQPEQRRLISDRHSDAAI